MFNRFANWTKSKVAAVTALLAACVLPTIASAQLDVSAATGAISDGETAVLTVLGALIAAFGAFLGLRMVMSVIKRGG